MCGFSLFKPLAKLQKFSVLQMYFANFKYLLAQKVSVYITSSAQGQNGCQERKMLSWFSPVTA